MRAPGYTLVEVVLALGIATILLLPLGQLVYQGTVLPGQRSAELAAENSLRTFYDWLYRDVVEGPAGHNLKDQQVPPTATAGPTGTVPTPTATPIPALVATPGIHLSPTPGTLLTIRRSPWSGPTPAALTQTHEVITYTLEPDEFTGMWRVMRTDPSGDKFMVLQYLADPTHLYITGDPRSEPGRPSTGIWVDAMVTVRAPLDSEGQVIEASTPQPVFSRPATATPLPGVTRHLVAYFEPRAFQPFPSPTAPPRCVWTVPVPRLLGAKTGYYHVIKNEASAILAAEWRLLAPGPIWLRIYAGTSLGSDSGLATVDPKTASASLYPVVPGAQANATTNLLSVASTDVAAPGPYTVYFYNDSTDGNYVTSTSATVTHTAFYRSDRC